MSAILAGRNEPITWTSRACAPVFYVYFLLIWSVTMGLIAAFRQAARGILPVNAYLAGMPEPLYALFGTGYLGYTVTSPPMGKIRGRSNDKTPQQCSALVLLD
jgi:hypothetical protein